MKKHGLKWVAIISILLSSANSLASVETKEARSFFRFHLEPQITKVGVPVTFFAQLETEITNKEAVAFAYLDGLANPVELIKSADQLWVARFPAFTEVKPHLITVKLYFRNKIEAARIVASIEEASLNIAAIEHSIASETDPDKLLELQAQLARMQSYKEKLELDLADLNLLFSTQTYAFDVAGDPANNSYPSIVSISPKVVFRNAGTSVAITGANFPLNPIVKIGSKIATVLSNSATNIVVSAPSFNANQVGIKDIEITFADPQTPKNALWLGDFTVSDKFILKNQKPVAVTGGYRKVTSAGNVSVSLNGLSSYDINAEDQYSYEWQIKSKPAGSSLVVGSFLSPVAQPSVLLDLQGSYSFQLKIKETNTPDLLTSNPSIETIEVKP